MRALGFEPKKEEIKKMIADIDKVGLVRSAPTLRRRLLSLPTSTNWCTHTHS